MHYLNVLLVLLPLLSAALVLTLAGTLRQRVARLSVGLTVLTLAVAVVSLIVARSLPSAALVTVGSTWGSLYADPLGGVMAVLVSAISLVVRVYSIRYMAEEAGFARFYALLDLMTAAIMLMVTAGDLVTLLVAWQLVGILLYFLLGHDLRRPAAERYAFWTFITYRLGDLPLLLAAILLYQAFGTLSLPALFELIGNAPDTTTQFGLPLAGTVGFLVALAAFARSAQFPLHGWLAYSMEGPTPVSVLMHAGIVNAGGFQINRFAPIFIHSSEALHMVFVVGLVTAILGSALMLTQNDIKKALGYSTMGQMGFMMVECGVGAFSLAIYHLIAHGIFKGTLFLGAGNLIGSARKQDGVPHDDVYTFIIERKPVGSRQPWILAAAITVLVPFAILALTHWLVGGEFVGRQGALILLFFGWVTGAQLLFLTYRMRSDDPWRLMALIIVSLAVVVAGYTVMEHAFDLLLYPDRSMSERIFQAAAFPVTAFEVLVTVITLAGVAGWLARFYSNASRRKVGREISDRRLILYSLISREFYVADVYEWLSLLILRASRRLNLWLRWL